MPKKPDELSKEDLIALIEERAEDVCGGKMYEVEVKIDELEEDLEASKLIIKNLEQSLKQTQSDLQSLSQENKQLKNLVNTLQENKELRSNNEVMQLKKEIDALKKDKPVKTQASEIKKIQQEVEELKVIREEIKVVNNCKSEIEKLKWAKEEVQKIREDAEKQHRRFERLEHEYACVKVELKKNHLKLDELEQEKYQNSVQVVGLPDKSDEDDLKQFLKIAKDKLGIKLKANDIETMSRLGKRTSEKTRNLNVTFKDKSTREQVYQQRKKLIQEKKPSRSIYINDRLTKHRQSVLYTCRRQVRAKKLFAAWSQGGNVLIRKEEHGNIQQIYDHYDVREILEQTNTENNTLSARSNEGSSIVTHLSNYSFEYDSDI